MSNGLLVRKGPAWADKPSPASKAKTDDLFEIKREKWGVNNMGLLFKSKKVCTSLTPIQRGNKTFGRRLLARLAVHLKIMCGRAECQRFETARRQNQPDLKVAQTAIGHWSQGALFSKDGKTVGAMNMVENDLQVFSFTGYSLKETGRIKLDGGPAAGRTAGVN